MIEPTESYTKKELDRFAEAVLAIKDFDRGIPTNCRKCSTLHADRSC